MLNVPEANNNTRNKHYYYNNQIFKYELIKKNTLKFCNFNSIFRNSVIQFIEKVTPLITIVILNKDV